MNEFPPIVIRGGRVVTPDGTIDADVLIRDNVVAEIGSGLDVTGAEVIDASGSIVAPGLVDIHTHLREPGREEAEDMETGTRAAALGGYTAVVAMPNTEPAIDSVSVVQHLMKSPNGLRGLTDVAIAGSITVGRKGKQLTPMAELAALGVRIFTDDGNGVQDPRLMLRALQYASSLDIVLAQHCEDEALSAGGFMHEGAFSSKLGIEGIPAEAEEVMVMRDIALARKANARMHFLHLSTARSVQLVREAKAAGMDITAEAAPHHFTLTDEELATFDPVFRVNPPLRGDADRAAVREGLVDGTIDAIATDHAPHVAELKELPLTEAPCGMLGLETALALANTELGLSVEKLIEVLSTNPANIARLDSGHGQLAVGRTANVMVFDPTAEWTVDRAKLASKSNNTPFHGRKVTGKVRYTILNGEIVVKESEAVR